MNDLEKLKEIFNIMDIDYVEEFDGEDKVYIITNDLYTFDSDTAFVFDKSTGKYLYKNYL